MSERRRSSRKRPARDTHDWSQVSSSHYVGYVEDGESITAIMKKFEELERLKDEAAGRTEKEEEEEEVYGLNHFLDIEPKSNWGSSAVPNPNNTELTQEQLEELFIRTSCFTLESADAQTRKGVFAWLEEEEKDFGGSEHSEFEEYEDYSDDEWQEELCARRSSGPRRRSRLSTYAQDREALMKRYRELHLQDASGTILALKNIQITDPSLPTYVRIPPNPVPISWSLVISPLPSLVSKSSYCRTLDIRDTSQLKKLPSFQAILLDPPLLLDNEPIVDSFPSHRHPIRLSQLKKLPIPKLLPNGFLLIWVEKRHQHEVLKMCTADWGLRYIENLACIYSSLNNSIDVKDYSGYVRSSKSTLLMFRKDGEIDLRHQRTADCVFDVVRPKYSTCKDTLLHKILNFIVSPVPVSLRTERPKFVYSLIETLLPGPVPDNSPRFLELWTCPSRAYNAASPWFCVIDSPTEN